MLGDIVRGLAVAWLILVIVVAVGLIAAAWVEGPGAGVLVTLVGLGLIVLCLTGIDTARGQ